MTVNRRYFIDETSFDNPSADGRYWIGFLMADGNVSYKADGGARMRVNLAAKDYGHLESLSSFLKSNYPVRVDASVRKVEICGRSSTMNGRASLEVTSTRLVDALVRHGVVPRKSLTARAELLAMDCDFWRGVVDGDGSIGFGTDGYPRVSLIGSKNLVRQFAAFCESVVPELRATIAPRLSSFTFKTHAFRAAAIVSRLYSGCSAALPRKLKIAKEIIAWSESYEPRQRDWSFLTAEFLNGLYDELGEWVRVAAKLGADPACLRKVRARLGMPMDGRDRRRTGVPECSVDGCARPSHTRGLCSAHAKRLARHGHLNLIRQPREVSLEQS